MSLLLLTNNNVKSTTTQYVDLHLPNPFLLEPQVPDHRNSNPVHDHPLQLRLIIRSVFPLIDLGMLSMHQDGVFHHSLPTDPVNNIIMDLNSLMILMRGQLIRIGMLIQFKVGREVNLKLIYV